MAIGPINTSALFGIQRGYEGLRTSAAKIASASQLSGTESTESRQDLARTLVGLKEHSYNIQANVKVLQAEDQILGTLLDERV
jgi:flagellar hook protein FlgE